MLCNNIDRVIGMIPLFSRQGTQSILSTEHADCLVDQIDAEDLANPDTTYRDPQCGTGSVMLVLAKRLMSTLTEAIPNEQKRLQHIFKNQLYLSDIDQTQCRIARANLLRAVNSKDAQVNVEQSNCFDIDNPTTYTISSIEFTTTNDFVPRFLHLSKQVIVSTRANKTAYEKSRINDIDTYQFLGVAGSGVPLCMMSFKADKSRSGVLFTDGKYSVTINNPEFLPGHDLDGYLYVTEVLDQKFEGYQAQYGAIGKPMAQQNPGTVPLIFGAGDKHSDYGITYKVSKKIITERNGLGKNKLVVSKNGNRGGKSVLKFAGPDIAVGDTVLWIEMSHTEFKKINQVWEHEPSYDKLIRIIRETSPANGVSFWKMIPNICHLEKIKKIHAKYY